MDTSLDKINRVSGFLLDSLSLNSVAMERLHGVLILLDSLSLNAVAMERLHGS